MALFETPESIPATKKCYQLEIPDSKECIAFVMGALQELADTWNWEQVGTVEPDEIADVFKKMIASLVVTECNPVTIEVGSVIMWTSVNLPSGWYFCHGQSLAVTDFPTLFNAIGYEFTAVAGGANFNLPDMRDRLPRGSAAVVGVPDIGDTEGADEVTLTTPNLPAHTHGLVDSLGNVIRVENGASSQTFGIRRVAGLFNTNNVVPLTTQSTGSGTPVSVKPKSMRLEFIIYAGDTP